MQANTAQFDLLTFRGRCAQQPRKPCEGYASVRPSLSSTHIVCSSKRTLVAEMVMRSIVARMELRAIRDRDINETAPEFASLHPGYAC
jgi:hypothetical protein